MSEITLEDYHFWKSSPVTKALIQALEDAKSRIDQQILDPNVIVQGSEQLMRLVGNKEGIDLILNIDAGDLVTNGEEPHEDQTSRSQNLSTT